MNQGYQTNLDVTVEEILFLIHLHNSVNPILQRELSIVKMLIKRCTAARTLWRLALLGYLATSLDGNTPSPSELMGKHFKCTLPTVNDTNQRHSDLLAERHETNKCHNGCDLPEIPVGSTVAYCDHVMNNWKIAIIVDYNARSYIIKMQKGNTISRNRTDLKPTNVKYNPDI